MVESSRMQRRIPSWLLFGVTADLALRFLLSLTYLIPFSRGPAEVPGAWRFLVNPGLFLVIASGLTGIHERAVTHGPRWLRVVAVGLMLVLVGLLARSPWGWQLQGPLVAGQFALLALLSGAALTWRRKGSQPGIVLVLPLSMILGAALLILTAAPISNHLGLVSFEPNTAETRDYADMSNKDDYPPCAFEYNSLGYRDLEPAARASGRTRVLVIGDSYVWGDGIPRGTETLPQRLRQALEARSPGQFDVVSGAFPGIDLYGYLRFTTVLQEHFDADLVVISYLGDCALSDAQYILDRAPDFRPLRLLLAKSSVLQHAHEFAASINDEWRRTEDHQRFRAELLAALGERAATGGYDVLFLNYDKPARPRELQDFRVLNLPQELKYTGERSELWYAKDEHPKPRLVQIVAELLAEAITGNGAAGRRPPRVGDDSTEQGRGNGAARTDR